MNWIKKLKKKFTENAKSILLGILVVLTLLTLSIILIIFYPSVLKKITLCPFNFENINFVVKIAKFFFNIPGLIFFVFFFFSFFCFKKNWLSTNVFFSYNNLLWHRAYKKYLRTLLYPHYWILCLPTLLLFFSFTNWLLIIGLVFGYFSKEKYWRFISFLGLWINSYLYWTCLFLYNCVWKNAFSYWIIVVVGYILYAIDWMIIDKINSLSFEFPKLYIRPFLFIIKKFLKKTLRKKARIAFNTSKNCPLGSQIIRFYFFFHILLWILIFFPYF